jgi:predicted nucleic-acid-binding Zn-ribbon protein
MMLYKSCPKCRGDLGVERDIYGGPPDLVCIQCGYTARPQERISLLTRLVDKVNPRPQPAYARVPVERRRAS